jgi:hypothetical protein
LCRSCREFGLYNLKWRAKIPIFVNFDRIDFLGIVGRHETDTVLFVRGEADALVAFFMRLFPLKLLDNLSSLGANDEQVFSRLLLIPLLAAYNKVVAR